jgi:hypothetical protein
MVGRSVCRSVCRSVGRLVGPGKGMLRRYGSSHERTKCKPSVSFSNVVFHHVLCPLGVFRSAIRMTCVAPSPNPVPQIAPNVKRVPVDERSTSSPSTCSGNVDEGFAAAVHRDQPVGLQHLDGLCGLPQVLGRMRRQVETTQDRMQLIYPETF